MFEAARARVARAQRAFRHVALLAWRRFALAFPRLGRTVDFSWEVLKKYYKDDCFSYAAGLSFWLIISLVPMSTLLFKMLGLILGKGAYAVATQRVLETIVPFLPQGFVEDSIRNSQQVGGLGLSLPVLLFGSYWGIGQLDTSLAHVFGLRIKKHRQTRKNPLFRQVSLLVGGMILLVLFIALLVGGAISRHLPPQMEFLPYMPPLLCLIVLTILLQHLPRLHVKWRHAFLGSLIATTLWWAAKWGFAVYLNHTFTWGIMYGSMLSMVAGLTFLYYSSAIFLLGAEITAAFYRHESGTTSGVRVPANLRAPKP
ncbi:MAG: YihY/virulence factor BrkB family protein [Holophaga sp.]|nr:YihY/virulence factor BrkB family protein [Holophaga sp.]